MLLAQSVKDKNTWEKLLQQRIAVEKTKFLEVLYPFKTAKESLSID